MFVFFVLVIIAGALLFSMMRRRAHFQHGATGASGPTSGSWSASPALQLLDERLARGEIDAEDYKTRRTLLSANS